MSETDIHGTPMSDEQLRAFLTGQGYGHLSLANDGETYAIPMSFGYDGDDRIYLYLIQFGEGSRKFDLLETTETATLSVATVESESDWQSAVVRGSISPIADTESEEFDEVLEDNAWFPSLFPATQHATGIQRCVLEIEEMTGRTASDETNQTSSSSRS